ncbi:MAG: SPASM domain-containing protein [Candidatus Omnitrophica bacterium]|nr:SPASM domain-containing protein [Candidatus Omnitrophota bacterium]
MKLSKFNLWVKDYPKPDDYLLFNTRTQALIKINPQLKKTLDGLDKLKVGELGLIARGYIAALKESGIIVEDETEEQAKLNDFFRQLKYGASGVLPFEATILTTYACNFRCVYCFEESIKDDVFLDKKTSDSIVSWVKRRAQKKKFKRIHLVYYGGEPLLNVRPIYEISWELKEWARKEGVDFSFGIITNGSLINPGLIDKFLTVGLSEVRISLDGDRAAHDKNRPFLDGHGTFDLIVSNIKGIIDKVKVAIAGNFDRGNFASIPRLLDYLEKEAVLRKLDYLIFSPIVPRLGPKNNPSAIELNHCLSFLDKDGLFNEVISIKRELLKRNLKLRNSGLAINACSLTMQDAGVTIDPRGLIYKCNSLLGYPEFAVGDVYNDEFNEKHDEFLNIDAWNKCSPECPYVPMCQGGCRLFSYLEQGNFSSLSCKKEYFDRITPELIKLEYDKTVSKIKEN